MFPLKQCYCIIIMIALRKCVYWLELCLRHMNAMWPQFHQYKRVDTCALSGILLDCHCRYLNTVTLMVKHCSTKRLFSPSKHTSRGHFIPCCSESIMDRNPPSWSNKWILLLASSHTRMWPRASVQIPKGISLDPWPV